MSNRCTPTPALAVKIADVKLISYDFGKYGDAAERKRLLSSGTRVYAAVVPSRCTTPAVAATIRARTHSSVWRCRAVAPAEGFCRFCGTLRCVRHRRRTQHTVAHLQSRYR